MTQEDKEFLIKDLSARLPYHVLCRDIELNINGELISIDVMYNSVRLKTNMYGKTTICPLTNIRPYLRPITNITKKEIEEFENICVGNVEGMDTYEWLHKHQFDYRELIKRGLAIDTFIAKVKS